MEFITCSDAEIRNSDGLCLKCPDGYEVVNNDCMETADTYNERLRTTLKEAYANKCKIISGKYMYDGILQDIPPVEDILLLDNAFGSEWKNGNRENTDANPWDNLNINNWTGPAPYIRLGNKLTEPARVKDLKYGGTDCCFRERTDANTYGAEICGTASGKSTYHSGEYEIKYLDVWLRSPENHVRNEMLRRTSNII